MTDAERSSSPNESQFEQWLAKSVYRVTCPNTLQLGEYAVGMLSGVETKEVEAHLKNCPKCRQELNFFSRFMSESTEVEFSQSESQSLLSGLQNQVRRLVAVLQKVVPVDGFGGQIAMGTMRLRGTVGDELLYQVDDVQIVIDIQRDPEDQNLRAIYGLVLGLEEEQLVSITLQREDRLVADTTLDEIGSFSFNGLAKGEYKVHLHTESVEVEIKDLKID